MHVDTIFVVFFLLESQMTIFKKKSAAIKKKKRIRSKCVRGRMLIAALTFLLESMMKLTVTSYDIADALMLYRHA